MRSTMLGAVRCNIILIINSAMQACANAVTRTGAPADSSPTKYSGPSLACCEPGRSTTQTCTVRHGARGTNPRYKVACKMVESPATDSVTPFGSLKACGAGVVGCPARRLVSDQMASQRRVARDI